MAQLQDAMSIAAIEDLDVPGQDVMHLHVCKIAFCFVSFPNWNNMLIWKFVRKKTLCEINEQPWQQVVYYQQMYYNIY